MKKISLAVLAAAALLPASAAAQEGGDGAIGSATWTPANATYSEHWITTPDGTKLHADVLRPKGLPAGTKVPAILSIGPYFNKSGQLGPANVSQDPIPPFAKAPAWDPAGPSKGMSTRFRDLVEGAKLMERGYAFVAVDLRGFGGSSGCLDWVGPGEQQDVVASVNWAASQDWSSGAVGMYGKSYDASTGLAGLGLRPPALKAVVAQEPVYDMYRYEYGDGQRRNNAQATPLLYSAIAAAPGPLGDIPASPTYNVEGQSHDLQKPGCHVVSPAEQTSNDDHYSAYWRARNLIRLAKGSTVPLFLMQGFTEINTVADGMEQFLRNHEGPFRAWFGPWEHVRGNEKDGNKFIAGRSTWFDEVVRFYDKHLKGVEPTVADPNVLVQTIDGRWRAEQDWPPADQQQFTTPLRTGTYEDLGTSVGTDFLPGTNSSTGIWTVSDTLTRTVHLAGGARVDLDLIGPPRSNVAVNIYDVDPKTNKGQLVSWGGALIRNNGRVSLEMVSNDWKFKPGRRIAVRVTETNREWWLASIPTRGTVQVLEGSVTLPLLTELRSSDSTLGVPGTQIAKWTGKTAAVPAGLPTTQFTLPPAPLPPAL